ncbi:Allantoicase [Varanus komodoensis]|nr:Allantoicase [Varanus komodoensis]
MSAHLREGEPNVLPDFLHMNDLACETTGGKILFATDDFFAPAENLLKKQRPVFHADLFTEYGKWRDGWETRRKRIPGHDWCIIQLGVPGIIYGFEADTSYLAGNCAPWISIQAAFLKPEEVPLLPPRGMRMGTAASDEELQAVKEFRAHISKTTKKCFKEVKTHLAVIPGGLTSQLQPLDVSIFKPFEVFMREEWNKWMAAGNHDLAPTGRMKRPTITQVCEWVKTSWHSGKEEIVQAFKKCGISNALDGTEDGVLYEDSEESDVSDCEQQSFIISDSSDDEFYGFNEN